ncbi:MAG: hypothetical protein A2Y17_00345 [Clostridiales bacterium GWF2_38_85]|nr:MAG: hypothetical protein A2Y17_00345 [Clostridiales bacterium GWF2_38_85]HBL83910.1 hypothetical protein [Clostridiales bacterium]
MRHYYHNIHTKNKIQIIAVISALFIICLIIFRDNNISQVQSAFNPIICVATDESVYSITASLDSNVQLTDFRTFIEVANGLNIKITFFVSESFFKTNVETIKEVMKYSHEIGFLLENDTSKMSRNEIMRYLANFNDEFYKKCDRYPKYVKYKNSSEEAGNLFDVLAAFGQYSIGLQAYSSAESGVIVDIGYIDATSSSKLISLVTDAITNKLTSVPLRDLLYDVDIPADTDGKQKYNE